MTRDPRIDAYIDKQAEFARPILERVRALVHEACPEVEETIKWSMPTFVYGGGILCGMAAYKQHVSFGYWKHALVVGEGAPRDGMGSYGKMTSVKDLPPKKTLIAHLKKAMQLNLEKTPPVRKASSPKPPPQLPDDMAAALKKNAKARKAFDTFPPSAQRDYVDWIVEAKREATRASRLAQAIEWMAEGKRRNWKYETC
ncbi:YdeI/OmpD-associated family protein [Lysobacter sp. 2RAF19]